MPVRAIPARPALGLAVVLAAFSAPGFASPATAAPGDARACDQAGAQAELAHRLPPGLLRAIGRIESGRRDPAGGFAPWPFTINAAGQGAFFPDAAAAVAAVRTHRAAGTTSIDVGCFQVNLLHHPYAFPRIEDGFDPAANAAYAGAFLAALRQRLGGWEAAVAAYHSATPDRGEAYRARVYATWQGGDAASGAGTAAVGAVPLPAPRPLGPAVVRIAGPDLAELAAVIRVVTPSRPGSAPARIAMPPPRPEPDQPG
jgi:hypothetical protein